MVGLFKRRKSAVHDSQEAGTGKGGGGADRNEAMSLSVRYSSNSTSKAGGGRGSSSGSSNNRRRAKEMRRLSGTTAAADASLNVRNNNNHQPSAEGGARRFAKLFGWRPQRKPQAKTSNAPRLEDNVPGSSTNGFVEVGVHDLNVRRRDIHLHARNSPSIFLTDSAGDWLAQGNSALPKHHQNNNASTSTKLRRRSNGSRRKPSVGSSSHIATTETRRHRRPRRRRSGLWQHVRRVFLVIILGVVLLLFTVLIPLALQIFKMIPAMSSVSENTRYLMTAVQRNFQSAFALTIPDGENEKAIIDKDSNIAMGGREGQSNYVIESGTGFAFEKKLRSSALQGKQLHLVGTGMKGVRVLTRNIKIYGFGIYIDLETLRNGLQDNDLFGPTIEPIVKEKAISDGEDEVFSPRKATKRLTNRSFGSLDELQQRAERVEKANAMVDSDAFYAAIIESQAQMTARLVVYFQNLKMEQVRSAFRNSLSARIMHYLPQDCHHQGSQYVQELMDVMKDSIKLQKGTVIDFQRSSDGVFSVIVDNKLAGKVESESLCRAFFDLYIGHPPTTEESRLQVGQSVASFLMGVR